MFKLNQLLARKQIKFRILIPLVLAMGVLLATFAFAIWRVQQKDQARDAALSAQEVERWLLAEENEKTAVMKTTIEAIMNDGQLIGAFRQRDRAALLERAKPLFDSLRSEHSITHFYFHLPDRTVWLRVHDPGANGDKIDRHTMLEAERTGKVSVGFERGLTGIFTLRVVSPWRQDGQLLGYLELGVEFESLVQDIHKKVNEDVDFVVAVDKKFLDREQWAAVMKREGWTDDWNRFPRMVVINKTVETLPKLAVDYLLTENPRPKGSRQWDNFQLAFLPLTDAAGEEHGKLIVLQNVAEQMAETSRSIRFVVVISLAVGAVVIGFFYFFLTGVENDLSDRTAKLKNEIAERKRAEEALQWKTAFLEAQVNSSIDGILVVDQEGKKPLQNQRFVDLFKIPQHIADEKADEKQLRWITGTIKNPGQFIEKIVYLNSHPNEISRDEIELKDGTILDRHSSPVVGKDGKYYGRIWTFRDITERRRAEEEIRRMALVVDTAPNSITVHDFDGRFLYANQRAFDLHGFSRDEFMALNLHQLDVPADERLIAARMQALHEHGEASFEVAHFRKDGTSLPLEIRGKITTWGGKEAILSVATDITERKQSEEVLTFLAQHSSATPGEGFFESLARYLAKNLGMDFVCIDRLEGDGLIARTVTVWCDGKFEDNVAYALKDTPCGEVVGKTVCCFPASVCQFFPRDTVLKDLRAESYVGVTLWSHTGQPIGLIAVIGRRPLANRPLAEAMLKLVSVRAASELERQEAEMALRESERRFSDMLRNLELVAMMLDRDARITYCNDYLLRLTGWRREEVLGRDWFKLFIPPEFVDKLQDFHSAQLADQPIAWHHENEIVTRSGARRLIRWNNSVLRSASGDVIGTANIGEDITEYKRVEDRIKWLSRFPSENPNPVLRVSAQGVLEYANAASDNLLPTMGAEVGGAVNAEWQARIGETLAKEHPVNIEFQVGDRTFSATLSPIVNHGYVNLYARDITESKRLEAQLFQSQKLETVGKLAGGVAHEFNSILTAIIGHSELILGDLPSDHPLYQNAAGIRKAAERAAKLTRQLLAYGRRAFLRMESLDLNQVMASMEGMVRQLMGADVDVRIVPAEGLHAVKADAGQIEQVIMNLAMNAHDAMPNGGKLTLETANVSFDPETVGRDPELTPGNYVMLAITDTGTGMSGEVKARVFEPFFTTKGVGEGTGLGLSTCYGIIKQSGGHISVCSEPGRGTTFKIYLPQVEPQAKIPVQRLDSPDLPRGTETILLVEDDPALREMAATLLRRLGYTVLAAANGIEALSQKQQRDNGHVDLLFTDVVMPHFTDVVMPHFTDVVMPHMSGKELADRVQALHPHTRVLFTSAYTENAIVHQGVLNPGVALLQKPFTPSALAHKLREVLDAPGAPKPDPRGENI
jgi:PAS domain S-box-containing protein